MLKYNFLKVTLGILVVILTGLISSAFLDSASAQAPRNVIIIMTDDQNVDSLPVMRKLMSYPEGSWVNFTNAIENDSICCPARATVLTGIDNDTRRIDRVQLGAVSGVDNGTRGSYYFDAFESRRQTYIGP